MSDGNINKDQNNIKDYFNLKSVEEIQKEFFEIIKSEKDKYILNNDFNHVRFTQEQIRRNHLNTRLLGSSSQPQIRSKDIEQEHLEAAYKKFESEGRHSRKQFEISTDNYVRKSRDHAINQIRHNETTKKIESNKQEKAILVESLNKVGKLNYFQNYVEKRRRKSNPSYLESFIIWCTPTSYIQNAKSKRSKITTLKTDIAKLKNSKAELKNEKASINTGLAVTLGEKTKAEKQKVDAHNKLNVITSIKNKIGFLIDRWKVLANPNQSSSVTNANDDIGTTGSNEFVTITGNKPSKTKRAWSTGYIEPSKYGSKPIDIPRSKSVSEKFYPRPIS